MKRALIAVAAILATTTARADAIGDLANMVGVATVYHQNCALLPYDFERGPLAQAMVTAKKSPAALNEAQTRITAQYNKDPAHWCRAAYPMIIEMIYH
jgi:hypothetical protein